MDEVGNYFGIIDYVVLGGTLIISLLIGLFFAACEKQDNEALLVGGRSMGTWSVATSLMVTFFSAIAILGYPAEIYAHGIQIILFTTIGSIGVACSALVFVPYFYNMKLTSIYEVRFESLLVRQISSFIFIVKILCISGIVLFAPSIALETFLGFPVWLSILAIGLCGTLYTSVGGLKAVVWTDVFQFFMIVGGMLTIVVKGFYSAGGVVQSFKIANEHGRLNVFDFTFDPFMRHNFYNFLIGCSFYGFVLGGTHQAQVQRYSSLPNVKEAIKAVLISIPMNFFVFSLTMLAGISIFATYAHCDPIKLGEIKKADQIIPYFVVNELSSIPGMMGLFTSCIFSAVLSTFSSILNSLVAVTWKDFFSHVPFFAKRGEKTKANISKMIGICYGLISISIAFLAQNLGPVLTATLKAAGAAAGPLGSIFIMGLFMPCVNKTGAVMGMLCGLISMAVLAGKSFFVKKMKQGFLPTLIDQCPRDNNISFFTTTLPESLNATLEGEIIEWPEKIFHVSYLLYPAIGTIITIFFGLLFSCLSGGVCNRKKVKEEHLHHWIRSEKASFEYDFERNNNLRMVKFFKERE